MIIDRIQIAGKEAYFQDSAGATNVVGANISRTKPLGKGKQAEVSAIEFLIESDNDLFDIFAYQNSPIIEITVIKEIFPTLFADPFCHRVHTIAGFEDFKRGLLENCRVLDVEGIPTIVSIGTETCKWTSQIYRMSEQISLIHASWEIAGSRQMPKENFKYSFDLEIFDVNQNSIQTISLANNFDPTKPRKKESIDVKNVSLYQIVFTADVKKDASLYEKHTTLVGDSIGTPLIRAVNLLEPVETIYKIHSLRELLSLSSEYHLFESQGQPLNKMIATVDLSATLVPSENDDTATGKYEFIEIAVKDNVFTNVEARLVGEILVKV